MRQASWKKLALAAAGLFFFFAAASGDAGAAGYQCDFRVDCSSRLPRKKSGHPLDSIHRLNPKEQRKLRAKYVETAELYVTSDMSCADLTAWKKTALDNFKRLAVLQREFPQLVLNELKNKMRDPGRWLPGREPGVHTGEVDLEADQIPLPANPEECIDLKREACEMRLNVLEGRFIVLGEVTVAESREATKKCAGKTASANRLWDEAFAELRRLDP